MPRFKQPLPEYSTLIRWTVQEVINWLAENSLSECTKCFRENGVDGNKLVNITDTDLYNIKCPRKYVKDILNCATAVPRPGGSTRPGYGNQGNKQRHVPISDVNHAQDGMSDDDGCWDENEFSDYDDENDSDSSFDQPAPVALPRSNRREAPALPRAAAPPPATNRRLPPTPQLEQEEFYEDPDSSVPVEVKSPPPIPNGRGRAPLPIPDEDSSPDEDYENPDAQIKVKHFHGGPLPQPPSAKPPPIGQRKPPPLPVSPVPDDDDSFSEPEETYEDPDSTVSARAPPIPVGPRRPPPPPITSVPKSHNDIPAEPSEVYEEPDLTSKPLPVQKKPPPPPLSSVPKTHSVRRPVAEPQEEYEDPDSTVSACEKKPEPPPLSKLPSRKHSTVSDELPCYELADEDSTPPPPVPRNIPRRKTSQPHVQELETYEVPDQTDSKPARPPPSMFQKNIPVPVHEEETYEVPDKDDFEEQDDYLDMDETQAVQAPDYLDITAESVGVPPNRPSAKAPSRLNPGVKPRSKMPLPDVPKSTPTRTTKERKADVEQETYELPVEETVKVPQKKNFGGVSVFPDLKLSNGVKESPSPQKGRALPPPPAVEKVEPVKQEAAKPVTSPQQPKEITEGDLLRQKWYHGSIQRSEANKKLMEHNVDGMYLIRKSSQGNDQPYTLQIFYKLKVYNLPIRRRADNLFAVGKEEKDNERAFASLLDLVNAFKHNILVLSGGAETKLAKSLPKT